MILIDTDRLVVRNFIIDDWQDLQQAIVNYQASEWAQYEDPWPTSDEKMKEIVTWFAGGDEYLAVNLKAENRIVGFVAINRRDDREEPSHNLGYILNPEYSGQGYATESCQACMGYVFDELKAASIVTGTHPDNEPSVRLLNRLGLKAIDNGEYTISKEEWLNLKQETI